MELFFGQFPLVSFYPLLLLLLLLRLFCMCGRGKTRERKGERTVDEKEIGRRRRRRRRRKRETGEYPRVSSRIYSSIEQTGMMYPMCTSTNYVSHQNGVVSTDSSLPLFPLEYLSLSLSSLS